MESLGSEHRWARQDTSSQVFRVAVIVVLGAETRNQAWRRHVREHPADQNADIKIFNFAISESPKNSIRLDGEHRGRRQGDETQRNLVGG